MNPISQSQISEYLRCKKRFFLSHVLQIAWPDLRNEETERLEASADEGQLFHRFVFRSVQGVDYESLVSMDSSRIIEPWIETFTRKNPLPARARIYAEISLPVIFSETNWVAKYDIIAVNEKDILIYDWKTAKTPPNVNRYRSSPQTRLYRFLLFLCRERFHADAKAEDIQMSYWFPNFPDNALVFPYSEEESRADAEWLQTLGDEMTKSDPQLFPGTENFEICKTCKFLTRCFPEIGQKPREDLWDVEEEPIDLFAEPSDSDDNTDGIIF